MLKVRRHRQQGFTLTELIVSSAIGLFILSGAVALYGAIVGAGSASLMEARLSSELRGTLDLITRDLRRAGYWACEPGVDPLTGNPFTIGENDIIVATAAGEDTDSCITFAYDRDGDKRVGVGAKGNLGAHTDKDNVEQLGFRLHDNAVESRISGPGPDCNRGRWQDITSSNIEITVLLFSPHRQVVNLSNPGERCDPGDVCQQTRYVEITIGGQLVHRKQTQRLLTDAVQIRNDRLIKIPG